MSLLFMDGFDHYASTDITKKWSTFGTVASLNLNMTADGRRGGGSFKITYNGANCWMGKTFAPAASVVVGFAFKFATTNTEKAVPILKLMDASVQQVVLMLNIDGTLQVTRAGTAVTNGTSASSLSPATWYYVELKVTIADSISAGTCKVRVNGVDVITVATGQDLKATANATVNEVRLGYMYAGSLVTSYFDDFYLCDAAGSTNNDFLGDCRIDTIYPTSDGNYSQFTCSTGSTHYALVDEATPNTSDYNDGVSANDRDSYGLGNLAALSSQTIYGVQVNVAALKDDAGAKNAATFVRSGSTNADGATNALGTSQLYIWNVFEQDPNAVAAWTETTVNAMEAGVKVVA